MTIVKAKEIADKYKELANCDSLLSLLSLPSEPSAFDIGYRYSGGWKVYASQFKGAGIDTEEIYATMGCLVKQRKAELVMQLEELTDGSST